MESANWKSACIGLGAMTAMLLTTSAPAAASRFDGNWSILIVTENGACEVYRFGVQVINGRVSTTDGGARLSGAIANSGAVNISLSQGQDTARATGKVSGGFGRGRWTSPTRQCSGRWEADKRS